MPRLPVRRRGHTRPEPHVPVANELRERIGGVNIVVDDSRHAPAFRALRRIREYARGRRSSGALGFYEDADAGSVTVNVLPCPGPAELASTLPP